MTFHERWIIVHEFRWAMATVTTHPKKIGQNTGLDVPKWLQPSAVPRCWKANPGMWVESTPQVDWPKNPTRKWEGFFVSPKFTSFMDIYIWCQDLVSWKVPKVRKNHPIYGLILRLLLLFVLLWKYRHIHKIPCILTKSYIGLRDHAACEAFQEFFTLNFGHERATKVVGNSWTHSHRRFHLDYFVELAP